MDVIFQESPIVELATNKFINVPTIIQWEDTPLMEVGKFEAAGYTTRFAIFHSDGTKLAVVKGSQFYPTEDGKAAKLTLRHWPNLTVCELEGKTVFELKREGAAALKGAAELYAPGGVFIRANDSGMAGLLNDGTSLQIRGVQLSNGTFEGHKIGIHVTRTGLSLGGSGGRSMRANIGGGFVVSATGGGGISFGAGPPAPPSHNPPPSGNET